MSSMIQIRNVPGELHRRLKARAAIDAAYVALAEALDAKLVTCDGKLAGAPGLGRRVELLR